MDRNFRWTAVATALAAALAMAGCRARQRSAFRSSAPSTLIAGDTSRYLYADTLHPTPYGYDLKADFVAERLAAQGGL